MTRGALWGVILAGGEGKRLRPFLRYVQGTERPKQFCAIIGTRSMLRHTVDRARRLIPAERTVTVVTAGYRPFVAEDLVAGLPHILLEQPRNRDTAAGIVLVLAVTALATPVSDAGPQVWTFSEDPVGEPPRGWEVLSGAWQVRHDTDGRNRVLDQPLPQRPIPRRRTGGGSGPGSDRAEGRTGGRCLAG